MKSAKQDLLRPNLRRRSPEGSAVARPGRVADTTPLPSTRTLVFQAQGPLLPPVIVPKGPPSTRN